MRGIQTLLIVCLGTLMLLGMARGIAGSFATSSTQPPDPGASDRSPAPGMFLVAQRSLRDPYFAKSVILLLDHDAGGSLGLIVNRKFRLRLADVAPDIETTEAEKHRLFFGGPVGMHQVVMLMRNTGPVPDAQHVAADIYFSADRQILEDMLERKKPDSELHLYLGYAGWTAGQLGIELLRGSWHLVEADTEAVFDSDSHTLWDRLIGELEPLGIEVRFDSPGDVLAAAVTGVESTLHSSRHALRPGE
jgi:putative transcriptional regulator